MYIKSETNTQMLSILNIDSGIPLTALTARSTMCREQCLHNIYKTVMHISLLYRIPICKTFM